MKIIYVVSDATGETAERVIRAALSQFYKEDVRVQRLCRIQNEDDLMLAMSIAVREPGMVAYTLVDPHLSAVAARLADENGLYAVDLLSGLIFSLSQFLDASSIGTPGLLHTIDTEYFKRMEAVNFTVNHDDGQELRNLHKADLVLVGASRSSKTPLAMYLAHKGYKVANVPLVKGIEPPAELFQVDQSRVFGLLVDPKRLVEIRTSRLINMRQSPRGSYADYQHVEDEINFCKQLYRRNPKWMIIDVTNRSVEETSSEILRRIDLRNQNA
ncbi:MAG TPA: pyruvate, water dikinase regulatory protein [Deltaproteobacteria bacterium]|nr:pyruvate, water dikinase regulatory protein [Deltaproteobacteria bacterium]HQB39581.1 pyruvate, water dikinase regulatory protein [Deltaproteobacteria bacterium]